jgi:hypothetical protein
MEHSMERMRIEWPQDGQVYITQADGQTWVGPTKSIGVEQKELLNKWGKYNPGRRAYVGVGDPPLQALTLPQMNRSDTSESSPPQSPAHFENEGPTTDSPPIIRFPTAETSSPRTGRVKAESSRAPVLEEPDVMVISSDESADEAIPEQPNTPTQRKRYETFIANGKRYIRGVKGMKIGRYIPHYDAYLVQEVPQGLPVVEINYATETTLTVVSVIFV